MEQLYWTPHHTIHSRLQSGAFVRDAAAKASVEEAFEWLQHGLAKFRPSNDASRKHISEKLRVDIKGKVVKYDVKHRAPALKLAKLLVRTGEGDAGGRTHPMRPKQRLLGWLCAGSPGHVANRLRGIVLEPCNRPWPAGPGRGAGAVGAEAVAQGQ